VRREGGPEISLSNIAPPSDAEIVSVHVLACDVSLQTHCNRVDGEFKR
jgi:hypothetical protein